MNLKIGRDGDPTSNRCKPISVLTQIWLQRWLPIHRLLAARFSTDLKQLPGVPWFLGIPGILEKLETSNRSNTMRVLTRTKCSCDDRLSMGYLLPDFQLIWSNFRIPSVLPGRKGVDTKGENYAHKTFDATEVSWYVQGIFSQICSKV